MQTTADTTERVVLRCGLSVPVTALRLLWDLENRGFSLCVEAGRLVVSPWSQVTAAEDRAIRRYRYDLLRLVSVCETVQ